MFIIAKTIKGQEYIHSKVYAFECNNKKQAVTIAEFLNNNNDNSKGDWKLKDNEIWRLYEIDNYDTQPFYKIKSVKGKISIIRIG